MKKIGIRAALAAAIACASSLGNVALAEEVVDDTTELVAIDDGSEVIDDGSEVIDDGSEVIDDGSEVMDDVDVTEDGQEVADGEVVDLDDPNVIFYTLGGAGPGEDTADLIAEQTAERVLDRIDDSPTHAN